jgi:hypothetical protein
LRVLHQRHLRKKSQQKETKATKNPDSGWRLRFLRFLLFKEIRAIRAIRGKIFWYMNDSDGLQRNGSTALCFLLLFLGVFAFGTVLAFHNITDGDLWAKLAIGSSVLRQGHLLRHDVFAFTPVLPRYIDHEWGAGLVFFAMIDWFGPAALMILKIALAFGAIGFAMLAARRQGCGWNTVFLLAIPAAACLLPGYVPVVRSHAFTFFLFAVTLVCLEELRREHRWAAAVLPLAMMAWANLHGGFVVGLGVVFLYAAAAAVEGKSFRLTAGAALACAAVTLLNPYGWRFWQYLVPALLHPRARIEEWRPLPLLARDDFWGFRILFAATVGALCLGRGALSRKNLPAVAVLCLTACLGWRSRRHGPFFAVAALAFAGPFFEAAWQRFAPRLRWNPWLATTAVYGAAALCVAVWFLPGAYLQPLTPVGEDPVREADILSLAGAKGNLATPFGWGSYLAWRLFPNLKISMDGRYETAFPESTFALNNAFYDKSGDWRELLRDYKVDYVILDLQNERLRPEDLAPIGYELVWRQENRSALLALPEHAAALKKTAAALPPVTIDPLDVKRTPPGLLAPGAL